MNKEVNEDAILYINLLIASQAVINSLDLLKGTEYYKGKVKETAQPFYIQLFKNVTDDIAKIYKEDEEIAGNMIQAIHNISKVISQGDKSSLITINKMLKEGFDFSKYKLVEI